MPVRLTGHGQFRSILTVLLAFTVALFILFNLNAFPHRHGDSYGEPTKPIISSSSSSPSTVPSAALAGERCRHLPGANDILVIIRTGATALRKRLPVYFQTTLQCIPHYVIFSDMEEVFEGHPIHDVLSGISAEMQESAPEFAFYREVHENKHRILEFVEANTDEENPSSFPRKAWDLDKWKFLPSLQRALEQKLNAKWFVFIEDDTFLVWSSLLSWLARLDWRESYFLGLPVTMEDQLFAYGGSGWVLSQAAIQQVAQHMGPLKAQYEDFTNKSAYGDLVLGHVAEQSGLRLTGAWPLIQRETPSTMEYTSDILCYPVITFHQVDASEIHEIWDLEQGLIAAADEHEIPPPLLHFDVFTHLVYPYLSARIDDWDNFSDGEDNVLNADEGFERCRRYCEEDAQCFQFRSTPGKCTLAHAVTLGWKADRSMNTTSGWMMERIAKIKASASCGNGKWDIQRLHDM